MTNEVAQLVAAELARIAAQNPSTDWFKIVNLIVSAVITLGLPFIAFLTLQQNAKSAAREEAAKVRNDELKKAVDGQTRQLIEATSIGQRALGKEEGVKEANVKVETITAAIVAATKAAPLPDPTITNLVKEVSDLKGAVLDKPVLNNPVLVNPVTKET